MPPRAPEYAFDAPAPAVECLLAQVAPVGTERVALSAAAGRVVGEDAATDRPSPPFDASAMDGFAIRTADAGSESLRIVGEARIGHRPPEFPAAAGGAIRIVTGAPVPAGADAVVMREHVRESEGTIRIDPNCAAAIRPGAHIRRCGENAPQGTVVCRRGEALTSPVLGALAAVGVSAPLVHRRVRVGVLCTGDELVEPSATPSPWQIRDSNGAALVGLCSGRAWATAERLPRAPDDPEELRRAVEDGLSRTDALLMTGGVSMGDRDYVPGVLGAIGARTLFHRIPQRPGRPVLAAISPEGKPILALPGNPVSVLVTARRFALPALRRLAGFARPLSAPAVVSLDGPTDRGLDLWWYRLVRLTGDGRATLLDLRGSGDLIGAAESDGFAEVPPGQSGPGPWPFYAWHKG